MANQYTSEDLKVLYGMSKGSSPVKIMLKRNDFSPDYFEKFMRAFVKEHDFIFKEPYEDLPLKIDDSSIEGFLRWRLTVGK